MTLQEKIAQLVRPIYCMKCLANLLNRSYEQVAAETRMMATDLRWQRGRGRCSVCGNDRVVIRTTAPRLRTGP